MDQQTLLLICIAGAVAAVGFAMSKVFLGKQDDEKLRDRLTQKAGPPPLAGCAAAAGMGSRPAGLRPLLTRVGQAAAQPFMPNNREKQGTLRQKLSRAGLYQPIALQVVTGAKVIFMAAGVIGGYVLGSAAGGLMLLFGLSAGGLFGYMAPTIWLNLRISKNQKALTYGLADALDLMVVCVEAGLTVDSAMQRVGQELALAHPALAREMGIAHMETRVGLSKSESLKNLGIRTGNPALQSLASMLIQAERFGTSIATALRVHSETLRQNRHHAAEELAAKASVKMTFPLVLFIFPATFIVLAGPTVIKMMDSPLFK
jgi:tight adherence protein C